ncbi:MAG: hypothetical protein ABFE13_04070 [Phycisphaerales bacterium]
MIEKRTVFILGAGASCPYGFPDARKLRTRILSDFETQYQQYLSDNGDQTEYVRMNRGYPEPNDVRPFLERFDLSGTESIDLFLSRNPRFEEIGKMSICLSILHAEEACKLREQVEKPELDWYFYLYNRLMREALRPEDSCRFGDNPISFVTFNYDRSLEYYLFNCLLHSFEGLDEEKAKLELDRVPVVHVYGKPALPEFGEDGERQILPFGKDIGNKLSRFDLLSTTRSVHVVHEKRKSLQLEKAREEIRKADRIFFLGFGYADENLEVLGIPDGLRAEHDIYGTAMDWTPKEIDNIRSHFVAGLNRAGNTYGRDQVQIRDCDCVSLLREFL